MSALARIRRLPPVKREREFPALVWVDPARRSGWPCVYGTRLTVEMVAEYVWQGMVDEINDPASYDVARPLILGACAYLVEHGHGLVPRGTRRKSERWIFDAQDAWRDWLDENGRELWYSRYDAVPYPPSRDELTPPTQEQEKKG